MNAQALMCFCVASSIIAALPVPAQAVKGLPPQVQASHRESVSTCIKVGGKPHVRENYVWRTDLNSDGKTDYVLDFHGLDCEGAESVLSGGSSGTPYQVFISQGNRYFETTLLGENGTIIKRGNRVLLRLDEDDEKTHFWGWNGKDFVHVR